MAAEARLSSNTTPLAGSARAIAALLCVRTSLGLVAGWRPPPSLWKHAAHTL